MSQVILITGASSGLGNACSKYLSEQGHIVYGTSRKATTVDNTPYHPLQMDVTKRESVKEGVAKVIEEQGHIDILINNAGLGIMGALELATVDEVRKQMDTNFYGVVNLCSEVLSYMRKRRQGKIINISSIGGTSGLPYQGFYSASKFAVEGYSEALRSELHKFNIKVVLIEPGDFNTNFVHNRQVSEATVNDEDYKDSFARTLAVVTKEELGGDSPIKLAKLMGKIAKKKNPKFRYLIGKAPQKLSVYLKHILPSKWHQAILRMYYKV